MKMHSLPHRFIRFFGKLDGFIMLAHLKVLKPQGNDYAALLDIEARQKRGEFPDEIIPWTDAEFDLDKVKALFVERFGCTEAEFDSELANLKALGYIEAAQLRATQKSKDKHVEIENDQALVRRRHLGVKEEIPLSIARAKLPAQARAELDALTTKEYTL